MPWLIVYLIKCSLSLACVYLFYLLVLRPLTFYRWNRFYLVGYSLLSFLLPFVDITPWVENEGYAESVLLTAIPSVNSIAAPDSSLAVANPGFIITTWDNVIYLFISGVLLMLFRFLMQWLSLQRVKRSAAMIRQDDIWLYDVHDAIHPFSFGKDIFINSSHHSDEELKKIIQHEFVHVKQQHSIDLIIAELLCIFNWYNPFAWLIRKAIRDNLEFIADNQVLESGTDAQQYQLLLLKVMGLPQYSITNQFSFSSLKKRIAMMNKLRSAQVHLVKFIFLLPVCAVILLAFRNKQNESLKKENAELEIGQKVNQQAAVQAVDGLPGSTAHGINNNVAGNNDDIKVTYEQAGKASGETRHMQTLQEVIGDGKAYSVSDIARRPDTVPVTPVKPIRQTKQLPEGVKSIRIHDNKATVTYKNGKVEKYDFSSEREKGEFDERWGEYAPPPPPVPPFPAAAGRVVPPVSPTPADAHTPVPPAPIAHPVPPAPPALPSGVVSMNVEKNKITLRLKNGKTEMYDMNNADQKAAYYGKYGMYPSVPQRPAVPQVPALRATPPVPPVKVETNGVEQLPHGTYIMGKEETEQMLAAALKRGELYIGIDNPLNALFDNIPASEIIIEWTGGSIIKREGVHIARPIRQGLSQMLIYRKENNARGQLLKSIQLNTKRLPDPTMGNETLKKENKKPVTKPFRFLPTGLPWILGKDNC